MKILFVDFDGVLNSPATWGNRPLDAALDVDKVQRLAALVLELEADVVISSSWRYICELPEIRSMLVSRGFEDGSRIVGMTPPALVGQRDHRGDEVQWWLDEHAGTDAFVIVDDLGLDSFEGLGRHLVQVDGSRGFTDDDCERVRRCFARQERERTASAV